MAKKHYNSKEKSMERRATGMISEDRNATANLPQDVKYHAWPKTGLYGDFDLDDTIKGIDEQIDADGRKMMRQKGGSKY